jgi:hypothetical protein
VADNSIGFDAAFLDKEVQLSGHTLFHLEVLSLNEKAVDADIQDLGDIVAAVAAPTDPDVFRSYEAS